MSFNDEQIDFFNKFLIRVYKHDMGKEIFDWVDGREMSFVERMTEIYNNDMKTYFQKEYIEEPLGISFSLSVEICYVKEKYRSEYERLFGEIDLNILFISGEPNILLYCQSLSLENLFVILQEEIGMELNEIYEMYGLDFIMPK
jgi:predicted RNA-binding protein